MSPKILGGFHTGGSTYGMVERSMPERSWSLENTGRAGIGRGMPHALLSWMGWKKGEGSRGILTTCW